MAFARLFLLFLSLLLVFSLVFADGIPVNRYDYHLEDIKQDSQLAYIDFDGQNYDLSLYIEVNFSGNDQDEILWVVPFKDLPEDISLEQRTYEEFTLEFEEFDNGVERAVELKRALEQDLPGGISQLAVFHFLPFPLTFFSFFIFSSASAQGREGIEPIDTYDFGELGSAAVFEIPEGATLEQFFSQIGAPMPSGLEHYRDRKIVVFRINRVKDKFGTLAEFGFSNSAEIFYPSSTTELWEGEPSNYVIKIRAPKDFKLSPNLKPNLEINDSQYQYMVFSPTCIGLGIYYDSCKYAINPDGYYSSEGDGGSIYNLKGKPRFSDLVALMDTDLEIGVKPERKTVPLGIYIVPFFPPLLIGIVLLWLSWIGAAFINNNILNKKKTKKLNAKEALLYGSYLAGLWTGLNWGLGLLYLAIILTLGMVYTTFSTALGYGASAAWGMLFLSLGSLVVFGGLGLVLWIFYKYFVKRPDRYFKFTKGKIGLEGFAKIGFTALLVFIALYMLAMNVLFIKI